MVLPLIGHLSVERLEPKMKDVIVEYTGKLGRDEEAGNCFSSCCMSTRVHKLDGMWSWVVCVAGILSNVLVLGSPYTFGVIFPTLLDELNEGKAKTGETLK